MRAHVPTKKIDQKNKNFCTESRKNKTTPKRIDKTNRLRFATPKKRLFSAISKIIFIFYKIFIDLITYIYYIKTIRQGNGSRAIT
jgi:uncharacterized membrane protein (DUF485 family)